MKVELKNLKVNRRNTRESLAFTATIYINGKKAGHAEDEGIGGPVSYHFSDPELHKKARAFGKSNIDGFSGILADIANEMEDEKMFAKETKQGILFRIKGDGDDDWRPLAYKKGVKVTHAMRDYLVKKLNDELGSKVIDVMDGKKYHK